MPGLATPKHTMINAKDVEFMNTRSDVVVSSCSVDLKPSMCWGAGGHVHADGRHVTVWLPRAQAAAMLADIEATGVVAAVFTEPFTSQALQVKGRNARVREARADDGPILARHLDNMIREIARVGFAERFVRAVFDLPLPALAAVEFTVQDLFIQTPGPHAGQPGAVTP